MNRFKPKANEGGRWTEGTERTVRQMDDGQYGLDGQNGQYGQNGLLEKMDKANHHLTIIGSLERRNKQNYFINSFFSVFSVPLWWMF